MDLKGVEIEVCIMMEVVVKVVVCDVEEGDVVLLVFVCVSFD